MVTINPRVMVDAARTRPEAPAVATSSSLSGLPRLVLASQSPRRRQLLSEHGLTHDATHPGLDDGLLEPGGVAAEQWVAALAHLKASAGLEQVRSSSPGPAIVIGADTVCVNAGQLIGQPRDAADAERILRLLQDGSHEVVTGVALLRTDDPSFRRLLVDRAVVRVGHLGEERIRAYVASGRWRGKAGAYNLGERIEAGWPIEYDGDPTTVMGLPMRALISCLARLSASPSLRPVVPRARLAEQSPDA